MRVRLMRMCALVLGVALPAAVQAQRLATGFVPTAAVALPVESFGSLGALTVSAQVPTHRLLVPAKTTRSTLAQADSLIPSDTHAQTGAIIGGVVGALGGGLAFAHFTHRAGGNNSTTGTFGGIVVGAGLIGTLGALVGLVMGSSMHE